MQGACDHCQSSRPQVLGGPFLQPPTFMPVANGQENHGALMISLSMKVELEQINQKFDEFASEHHLKIKNRDPMTYANF